jgi:hypothetical protein
LIENHNANFDSLKSDINRIKSDILFQSKSERIKLIDEHRKSKNMSGEDMQILYINALNEAKRTNTRVRVD